MRNYGSETCEDIPFERRFYCYLCKLWTDTAWEHLCPKLKDHPLEKEIRHEISRAMSFRAHDRHQTKLIRALQGKLALVIHENNTLRAKLYGNSNPPDAS